MVIFRSVIVFEPESLVSVAVVYGLAGVIDRSVRRAGSYNTVNCADPTSFVAVTFRSTEKFAQAG